MDGIYLSIPDEEYIELVEIAEKYKKERKKAKWLITDKAVMECSRCLWTFSYHGGLEEEWNYCPNCGAIMESE